MVGSAGEQINLAQIEQAWQYLHIDGPLRATKFAIADWLRFYSSKCMHHLMTCTSAVQL
jgi:hypothetical protein